MSEYIFPTRNGLVLSTQKWFNGNVNYATAMLLFLQPDHPQAEAFKRGLMDLEVKPGILSRYELPLTNTSIDDYLARCLDPSFAHRCHKTGLYHLGFISIGFSWRQFLFRFQGFWQHMKISSGAWVGPLGRYIWARSIRLAADKPITNQDGWIQSHLMILTLNEKNTVNEREGMGLPPYRGMHRAIEYFMLKKTKPTWEIMADYIGDSKHELVDAWMSYGYMVNRRKPGAYECE